MIDLKTNKKMQREIKFRGLFQGMNGQEYWAYGYLVKQTNGNWEITNGETSWTVDNVGQFTGIRDMLGKEIYEGDKVVYTLNHDSNQKEIEAEVEWHNHAWRLNRIWLFTEIRNIKVVSKPMLLAAAVNLSKSKIRAIVFNKCGGKCAYCGVDLVKGWNVDHIKPQVFGGTNDLENLNPSCKDCNNYKCHTDLEGYRKQLHKMLNEKLEYLFKSKTKMQVAIKMGSIKNTLWDGKFYFERVGSSCR